MNWLPLAFGKFPINYRMYFPDGSYIKYIEWMGVVADCRPSGGVNRIFHSPN